MARADRVERMKKKEIYENCRFCPRSCGIDRGSIPGACGVSSTLKVSRAALHLWEEPCISGTKGSGTVFFSGCSLGCVYCQNQAISRGKAGKEIAPERLTEIFFELEAQGANNINLVTADHFLPTVADAVEAARDQGIGIPFLLNTSSYVHVDTLKRMEGLIDIYLPDMKYIRDEDAIRYSRAPGYPEAAKAAIAEMVRQQPECVFVEEGSLAKKKEENGIMTPGQDEQRTGKSNESAGVIMVLQRGVVIRHLLLPGQLIQAKLIVRYLYNTYGDQVYLSLLNQYTPDHNLLAEDYPEIDRKVTEQEYHSLIEFAAELGVTRGFMQEGEAADESFIPEFDCRGV